MKLDNQTAEVEVSGQFNEYAFGIRSEDLGIVLDVLRSKMYSNPIKTICQEISSNARDANREANKSKTPIRIRIAYDVTSPQERIITFEDDGPGISPERMKEIFVNYGASTKRDTNRYTGGFGFGCKTPFAYTDQFQIITRVDGTKYTYQAAINQNRSGSVFMVNSEPCTESNGTTVSIPVDPSDIRNFESCCIESALFWDVHPELIGFSRTFPELKALRATPTYRIYESNAYYGNSGFFAMVDSIAYPVSDDLGTMSNYAVVMIYKTGDLSLSATRESLHYDDKTTQKLKDRIEEIKTFYINEAHGEIKKAKSYIEAVLTMSKFLKGPFGDLLKDTPFMWGTEKLSRDFPGGFELYKIDGATKKLSRWSSSIHFYPPDILEKPVYLMDLKATYVSKNMAIMKTSGHFYLLKKDGVSDADAAKILQTLKDRGISVLSYRAVKVKHVYDRVPKSPDQISVVRYERNKDHYASRFYKVFRERVHKSSIPSDAIWLKYTDIKQIADYQIFLVLLVQYLTNKCVFLSKEDMTLKPYADVLNSLKDQLCALNGMKKLDSDVVSDIQKYRMLDLCGDFKKILSAYPSKNYDTKIRGLIQKYDPQGQFLKDYPVPEVFKKMTEAVKSLKKTYPLLEYYRGVDVREFNQYIAMMDDRPKALPESCEKCLVLECHGKTIYGSKTCQKNIKKGLKKYDHQGNG